MAVCFNAELDYDDTTLSKGRRSWHEGYRTLPGSNVTRIPSTGWSSASVNRTDPAQFLA